MAEIHQKSLMIPVGPDGKMSSDQLPWLKPSTVSSSSWNRSPKLQRLSTVQQGGLTASESMHSKPLSGKSSSLNASSGLLLAGVLPKWSSKSSVLEQYPQATVRKASPGSGLSLLSNMSFQPESYSNTSQLLQHLQLGPLVSATGDIGPDNYTNRSQAACLWSASASPMILTNVPHCSFGTQPWDDPEGECQRDNITLAPSDACCTRCVVRAGNPTIAYLPSLSTMTAAGNEYVISNDTRKSKPKRTQHVQTASNSVYVLVDQMFAQYNCGLNSQQIGAKHINVTLGPYNPSELSTMNACNEFGFQSLEYSQLSLFTTSLNSWCSKKAPNSSGVYFAQIAFVSQGSAVAFPLLELPDAITTVDSLWKHCSLAMDLAEGVWDPPIALSMVPDLGPGTIGSFLPPPSAQPGSTLTPSYPTKTVQGYAAPVQTSSMPQPVLAESPGAVASRPQGPEIPGSSILTPQELISRSIDPIIQEEPRSSETQIIGILDSQQLPSAVELIPERQTLPRGVSMTMERANGLWPDPIILISDNQAPSEDKDLIIESSAIVGEGSNDVSLESEPSSGIDDTKGRDGPPSDSFAITPVASIAGSDNNFAVAPTATFSADTLRTTGAHLPLIPITLVSDSVLHEGLDGTLILAGATIRPGIRIAYASHSLSVGSGFVGVDGTEYILDPTSDSFSLETQATDEAPSGGLGLGSGTVRPGFQATFGAYSLSLGSKTIAVDGTFYTWLGRSSLVPVDGGSGSEIPGRVDLAGQDESLGQGQVSTVTESHFNRSGLSEGSLMLSTAATRTGANNEINSLIASEVDNFTAPMRTTTDNTSQGRGMQPSSGVGSSKASKAIPSKSRACRSKARYSLPAFGFLVGIWRTLVL